MNKRQKKKAFKKKYGYNPPRKLTAYKIHLAAKAVVKAWNIIKSTLAKIGNAIEQIFARLSKEQGAYVFRAGWQGQILKPERQVQECLNAGNVAATVTMQTL